MTKSKRFARSLIVSLREVICSLNFWLAAVLIFGVLFIEIAEDVFGGVSDTTFGAAYNFNISLHFGYYIYAAPLACAFAAGGSWINDEEAGFYRLRLLKSGKREYGCGLFVGSAIGGGLALMLGVMLFATVCAILYGTSTSIDDIAAVDAWYPIVTSSCANWNYMIVNALLAFLFGAVWSGVGLTISVYSPVRYVSYLSPFIICFCSALALPYSLQPLEMLVQMQWGSFTFTKMLLYQSILFIAVMVWFNRAIERRVFRA